jgi:hypothetical protein
MGIKNTLKDRKSVIVDNWVKLVLGTYESPDFFRSQKDRFANPVGANISEALKEIFDLLLEEAEAANLAEALDKIVRIRAVQDFAPSLATSFMFLLKDVVRAELAKDANQTFEGLMEFESTIDRSALMAFDIYMECRERLFQIRIKELQNGTHTLTDGTQCASAWLKRKLSRSADNSQTNSST